jgi:hypothetical protein
MVLLEESFGQLLRRGQKTRAERRTKEPRADLAFRLFWDGRSLADRCAVFSGVSRAVQCSMSLVDQDALITAE